MSKLEHWLLKAIPFAARRLSVHNACCNMHQKHTLLCTHKCKKKKKGPKTGKNWIIPTSMWEDNIWNLTTTTHTYYIYPTVIFMQFRGPHGLLLWVVQQKSGNILLVRILSQQSVSVLLTVKGFQRKEKIIPLSVNQSHGGYWFVTTDRGTCQTCAAAFHYHDKFSYATRYSSTL